MSNSIDLCTLADVQAELNIVTGVVNTTIPLAISSGLQTVTPANISNISVGKVLQIDSEYVIVIRTNGITFDAIFAFNHLSNSVVTDQTSNVLSKRITAASAQILRMTGRGNSDGTIPTSSVFTSVNQFSEWYDGTGTDRLFLHQSPIVSVESVSVGIRLIPVANSSLAWGYIIDQSKRCLVIRNTIFCYGTQNINVQYHAGYQDIPYELNQAAIDLVIINYKRRDWLDQESQTTPEGTIKYRSWDYPPSLKGTLRRYELFSY